MPKQFRSLMHNQDAQECGLSEAGESLAGG